MGLFEALIRSAGLPDNERTIHDCASSRDAPPVISLSYSSMIMAYSSQKSGYFQHLKQSDQIFSGSSVRCTS